ncbi:MAG TPA: hypothetical protein ENN14_00965 [Chloroflexi bacterium]|nr:hypothetical protein [Chloroflexota bacterium]
MTVSLLRRVRRNHALEHATINLLNRRHPQALLIGMSNPLGFTLYTDLYADEVVPALKDAIRQLGAGKSALAYHSNCGTNMVAAAALTMLATMLGLGGSDCSFEERVERVPKTLLLNVLALLAARAVGPWLQAHLTVDPYIAGVEIASVFTDYSGRVHRIRINLRHAG